MLVTMLLPAAAAAIPNPGPVPKEARPQGGVVSPKVPPLARRVDLIVLYKEGFSATPVVVMTEGGNFTCKPILYDGDAAQRCVRTLMYGQQMILSVKWTPKSLAAQTPDLKPVFVTGWRWGGACAGTSGNGCILPMKGDTTVKLDLSPGPR